MKETYVHRKRCLSKRDLIKRPMKETYVHEKRCLCVMRNVCLRKRKITGLLDATFQKNKKM